MAQVKLRAILKDGIFPEIYEIKWIYFKNSRLILKNWNTQLSLDEVILVAYAGERIEHEDYEEAIYTDGDGNKYSSHDYANPDDLEEWGTE